MDRDILSESPAPPRHADGTQEVAADDVLEELAARAPEPEPTFVLELAKVSKVLELRLEQMLAANAHPATSPEEIPIEVVAAEAPHEPDGPLLDRGGPASIAPVTFAVAADTSDADATLRIDRARGAAPRARRARRARWVVAGAVVVAGGILGAALLTLVLRSSAPNAQSPVVVRAAAGGHASPPPLAPATAAASASGPPVVSIGSLPLATKAAGCGDGSAKAGTTCQPPRHVPLNGKKP